MTTRGAVLNGTPLGRSPLSSAQSRMGSDEGSANSAVRPLSGKRRLPHAYNQMNLQHQINVHTATFGVPDEEEEETSKKIVRKKTVIRKDSKKKDENGLSLKSKFGSFTLGEQPSDPMPPPSGRSSTGLTTARSQINPLLTPILDEDFKRERFEDSFKMQLSSNGSTLKSLRTSQSSTEIHEAMTSSRRRGDDGFQKAILEPKKPLSAGSKTKLIGSVTTTHNNRAKLCIQTLTEGYVDAFEELFSLAHRDPIVSFNYPQTNTPLAC